MNIVFLVASFLVGVLLGCFYFGGLWWTVRRMPQTAAAGFWLLGSFVLRMAVVLTGFLAVSNGQWERIIASLIGFLIARSVVVRLTDDVNQVGRSTLLQGHDSALGSGSAGASISQNMSPSQTSSALSTSSLAQNGGDSNGNR